MSGLPWVLLLSGLGYLFVVGVIVLAAWILVRSTPEGRGSGCTGCLIALALVFVALLGAVGCTTLTVIGLSSEAVRHGPVSSIEIEWPPDPGPDAWSGEHEDDGWPIHLRVELDPSIDVSRLSRWIKDELDGDMQVSYDVEETPHGQRTWLDIGLPIDREEALEIRRELERELPELDLPSSLRIEIRARGERRPEDAPLEPAPPDAPSAPDAPQMPDEPGTADGASSAAGTQDAGGG